MMLLTRPYISLRRLACTSDFTSDWIRDSIFLSAYYDGVRFSPHGRVSNLRTKVSALFIP